VLTGNWGQLQSVSLSLSRFFQQAERVFHIIRFVQFILVTGVLDVTPEDITVVCIQIEALCQRCLATHSKQIVS
jgi:hypothetical protein